MSLTKFTGNTGVISGLPDEPTLSSAQLKGKFDEAGNAIKQYLNETLTVEIDQLVATEKQNLEGEISDLEDSMTEDISEAVENENKMISDNYSNLKTYRAGDLCIYNNILYRCTTTISVCESWNSEHWEETTINEQLKSKYMLVTTTNYQNLGSDSIIELNSVETNIGNRFKLENNRVIVGKGVSRLRVSGAIFVEAPQGMGYVWGKILLQGYILNSCIFPYNNGGGFLSVAIPPSEWECKEGDVLTLIGDSVVQGNTRPGKHCTWLYVEAIE